MFNRRSFVQTLGGGALALSLLESTALAAALAAQGTPSRLLVIGNPYGAHPEHFFPTRFGKAFRFPKTISSLAWLRGRVSILSHDYNSIETLAAIINSPLFRERKTSESGR